MPITHNFPVREYVDVHILAEYAALGRRNGNNPGLRWQRL